MRIIKSVAAKEPFCREDDFAMIVVVKSHNAERHSNLLEQMFNLRAQIFHEHLGWDVNVTDGKERDKYDDEGPVYIIYTDHHGRKVKGSLRLLPTTGPTLLADLFSDTIPDAVKLSAPTIWECTRFCPDGDVLHGAKEEILFASTVLLIALNSSRSLSGKSRRPSHAISRSCHSATVRFSVVGATSRAIAFPAVHVQFGRRLFINRLLNRHHRALQGRLLPSFSPATT